MSDKQSWRTAFLPATPRLIEQYDVAADPKGPKVDGIACP